MGGMIFKEHKITLKTHPNDIVKKYLPLIDNKKRQPFLIASFLYFSFGNIIS